MEENKNLNNFEGIEQFENYFKNELDAINSELEKSKEYSEIIDKQIKIFSDDAYGKGVQRYLIEHLKNAIELQTQRQGLRKDSFSIKKTIMDYYLKQNNDSENDANDLLNLINQELNNQRNNLKQINKEPEQSDTDLDAQIEKLLQE